MAFAEGPAVRVNTGVRIGNLMERDALKVKLGNGIEVSGLVEVRLDPRRLEAGVLNCISHAHSDHLPSSMKTNKAIASAVTLRCASARVKKHIEPDRSEHIEMLNAGHMAGSTMFLVDGGERLLYTGDMSPRDRFGMEGARPVKVDTLIIEATYGQREYVFPPCEEMAGVMRDWIEDSMHQGYSVALFTYPLGKSQRLLKMLEDMQPYLHEQVLEATRLVEEAEGGLCYRDCAEHDYRHPSVMICPMNGRSSISFERWCKANDGKVRTAAVSGWAVNRWYARRMGVSEGFAISDHADYHDLLGFAKACEPKRILIVHGSGEDLIEDLRKEGFEARNLVRGQHALSDF
jgi:putative mRNA 3-end processing factor